MCRILALIVAALLAGCGSEPITPVQAEEVEAAVEAAERDLKNARATAVQS
jgi:uncharacterized lipoprotein YmbA